jgi:inward rectifier potassium channel
MSDQRYNYDPGLGRKYEKRTARIINKDGSFNVKRHGVRRLQYQWLLQTSSLEFYTTVISAYLAFNVLFALVYMGVGVERLGGKVDMWAFPDFFKALFFSMQTFTTVGYGSVYPQGGIVSFVAGMEAMAGLMFFAIATGLVYGRFSRPSARILFSNNILISPYKENETALMFRIVNRRLNVLMEMDAQVIVAMDVDDSEEVRRRFYRLELETSKIVFFPLTWTIVHPITKTSPFQGLTHEDLLKRDTEVLILVKGYDETFSQHVHVRFSYTADELIWGARFIRNFQSQDNGVVELHIDDVHAFEKAELPND